MNEEPLTPRQDAIRRALVAHVAADLAAQPRRRRRRVWRITAFSLAGAVALTAGAVGVARSQVKNYDIVHCFARAEIDWRGHFPGGDVAMAPANGEGPIPIEDARAMCEQVWKDGLLDPDKPIDGRDTSTPNPNRDSPVPPELTVCVMRDGSAAVVPGKAYVCNKLGLDLRKP